MIVAENKFQVLRSAIEAVSECMIQTQRGKILAEVSKELKELKNRSTTVLVCGEFSSGKSTFINALIGHHVCPTDVGVCTSVVSIIKYGRNEKVTRIYGNLSNQKQEVIPIKEMEHYIVGQEETDDTICMEIELPLEVLNNGMIIIDTPGIGGLEPKHEVLTNFFLPRADITLFITDANEPLKDKELLFYKNRVLKYAKHSAIVVNKADIKEASLIAEMRQDVIKKISRHIEIKTDYPIGVIPVSSFDCIRKGNDAGNFVEIRSLLNNLIDNNGCEKMRLIRDRLSEQLQLVITPLQFLLSHLVNPQTNQIQSLESKENEINQKIRELSDPNAELRSKIVNEIDKEKRSFFMILNKKNIEFSTIELNRWMRNPCATSDSQWLGQQICNGFDELNSEMALEINKAFERVTGMKEIEGLFNYITEKYDGQIAVKNVNLDVPFHKKILAGLSGWSIYALGTYALGLTGLGVVAAAAAAIYVANRSIGDVRRGMQEPELRQVYLPQIQVEFQNMRMFYEGRFNTFHRELIYSISDRARQYQKSLIETKNMLLRGGFHEINLKKQLETLISVKEKIDNLKFENDE